MVGSNIRATALDSKSPQGDLAEGQLTEAAGLRLPNANQVFLGTMTVAPCRQTLSPATYRPEDWQRIRQVSGWGAISGLKGGFFLAQIDPQLASRATSAAPS